MSQEREGQKLEIPAPTPHERAMDRHEAALDALQAAKRLADEMVSAAEREVFEALSEMAWYEKRPGVPMPVDDQCRMQELADVARQRIAAHRGERQ